MKIPLNFKTPDVFHSIYEAFTEHHPGSFQGSQYDAIIDSINEIEEKLGKWIKYGEYLTVVYDTEKDTLTVSKKGN